MKIGATFFTVDPATVQMVLLALLRLGAAFLTAPPFQQPLIPPQVKIVLAASLLLLAWPVVSVAPPALKTSVSGLMTVALVETLIGVSIGFVARFALAAASVAAELVTGQMGFSMASQLDPVNGAQVTVITRLYDWTVMMVFLFLDSHYVILGILVESFRIVPVGGGRLSAASAAVMLPLGGRIFSMALALVAPLLGVLFVAQLVLVLSARAVPQINLISIGLPIMLGLGLLMLFLTIDLTNAVVARELGQLPEALGAVVRGFALGR